MNAIVIDQRSHPLVDAHASTTNQSFIDEIGMTCFFPSLFHFGFMVLFLLPNSTVGSTFTSLHFTSRRFDSILMLSLYSHYYSLPRRTKAAVFFGELIILFGNPLVVQHQKQMKGRIRKEHRDEGSDPSLVFAIRNVQNAIYDVPHGVAQYQPLVKSKSANDAHGAKEKGSSELDVADHQPRIHAARTDLVIVVPIARNDVSELVVVVVKERFLVVHHQGDHPQALGYIRIRKKGYNQIKGHQEDKDGVGHDVGLDQIAETETTQL